MISATVLPPSEPLEFALCQARAIIHAARTDGARALAQARNRASRYRDKAKQRGYRAGLEQARTESSRECAAVVASLRSLYLDAAEGARKDLSMITRQIVEELIEQRLREGPDLIESWIARAIEHLKHTSNLTLRYHPRYEEPLQALASRVPRGIAVTMDPGLGQVDFALDTNVGAITFSWRDLLRSFEQPTTEGRRI